MKTLEQLKALVLKQGSFWIDISPEESPIKGNVSAVDPETDREQELFIESELDSGNDWAWCMVKVSCSFMGLTADDYLGQCSYSSEKAFIDNNDYYADMKDRCASEIAESLFHIQATVF